MNEGKVKSRSVSRTQLKPRWVSPSWCRGCCALRGKSQDRRRWSAVMGLPSAVHVHSHGRSYTEIAAEWGRWHGYSRRLHLFARWVKSWRARLKVEHFLTQNAWSKSCEQKVALLALDYSGYKVVFGVWLNKLVKKFLTSIFFLTRRYGYKVA